MDTALVHMVPSVTLYIKKVYHAVPNVILMLNFRSGVALC